MVLLQDTSSCFAYPVSSPFITIDNFGEPIIKGSSPFIKVFSSILPVDNYANLNIIVAIYLINPNSLFNIAKISFLIILLATVFVFIALLVQYKNKNSSITDNSVLNTSEDSTNSGYSNWDIDFAPLDTKDNKITSSFDDLSPIDEDIAPLEEEISPIEEIQPSTDSYSKQEPNQSSNYHNNTMQNEETISKEKIDGHISDPQGLFSEKTGFGWESYLETRLDSELARAASSEQDLALFLIRIPNITFDNKIVELISPTLLSIFKFRDLVFEYGNDGYAAVVQGMNLDQAMAISESVYTDLSAILINNQINEKIGIGITTRSLRLLPGSRLITEAKQALAKSFEESGLPIVAFKVNVEDYKNCLSKKTN